MSKKMTKTELDRFAAMLIKKRNFLTGNIQDLRHDLQPSDNTSGANACSGDYADMGAGNYEQDLSFMLMQNEGDVLKKIDTALDRLTGGAFGSCESCETVIGRDRLKAIPWTPYCIECQRLEEAN